jgi:PAS domain S-box-containing protein
MSPVPPERDGEELRRTQEALRESTARFRGAFDHAAIGMALVAADGRLLEVNRSLGQITGYAEHELLDRDFQAITHPDDLDADLRLFRQLFAGDIPSYRLEKRYICKGGQVVWGLLSVSLVRDEQGRPLYAVGQLQDFTERKRLADQLREWKDRYEAAVLATGQVLYDYDAAADRVTYGGDVAGVLGYTAEEIGPHLASWVDLVHPDDRAAFREGVGRQRATREPFRLEYRVRRKDGTYATVEDRGHFPGGRAGPPTRMVGFVMDVTERRGLEEQLRQAQKMEAVGRLAGGVAHDFNNLLTVITGYSELALGELPEGGRPRELLQEVLKAAERAAALTRQLLDYGRKQVVRPVAFDLNARVVDVGQMLRRLIREDIEVRLDLQPGLGEVKADPGQVEQALVNLAVNAQDAMPAGGRLSITTARVEVGRDHAEVRPGLYALLAVADTGVGMTEAVKRQAFEPFFTTKPVGQGTGLGLAQVYGIAKQAGGHVEVESEPGQGATFRLYLPLAAGQDVPGRPEEKTGAVPT